VKIVYVSWHRDVNRLIVECECGNLFAHRTDRFSARCPECGRRTTINALRRQWVDLAWRELLPPRGGDR